MKIEKFFTKNYISKYQNFMVKSITDKQKEARLNFFQKDILKDKNIHSIKKEKNQIIITYQNGQIFKCSGWLVNNSTIPKSITDKQKEAQLNFFQKLGYEKKEE